MTEEKDGTILSSDVRAARTRAAQIAAGVLTGAVNPVVGAVDLNQLRPYVDVPGDDPDFDAFSVVSSETDHLPFGTVQRHWAANALAAKAGDIARYETWTMEFAGDAFRSVVSRFASAA
jgi:hypothetical protein